MDSEFRRRGKRGGPLRYLWKSGGQGERLKRRLPHLQGAGEEDSLIIRRVISRSGRGKVFINGNLATLGVLSEVGEGLLSIYGQHEHQSLQRVETHIDILDEFGGLLGLREEFQKQYQEFVSLSEEVERIRAEKERRSQGTRADGLPVEGD